MEVNDLKKQYNIILGRMKKGMKCCEELDITKKEDKVRLERYTDKIIELLEAEGFCYCGLSRVEEND